MYVQKTMLIPTPPFACPVHKLPLGTNFYCESCDKCFPANGGIPILINDKNSVFQVADYATTDSAYGGASDYAGHLDRRTGLRQLYRRFMSFLSESNPVERDFGVNQAIQHVLHERPDAQILAIGSGDKTYVGNVTYSDVAFGKNVTCIADAHDLPFTDAVFDACIVCAVLEHVADPQRCVAEIERVLRPSGFVFAETPFMQPVHMGAYDFTRFTYLGHRRLFRRFDEIQSGIAGGPGTSAAHLIRYLLVACSDRAVLKKWLKMVGLLATYPIRLMDRVTRRRLTAYDSASGFYFFGTLRDKPIPDREILKFYRGG